MGTSFEKMMSIADAFHSFADYLQRVARRSSKEVAQHALPPTGKRLEELPEILRSLPRLSDAEAAAFAEDLAAARDETIPFTQRDPWQS